MRTKPKRLNVCVGRCVGALVGKFLATAIWVVTICGFGLWRLFKVNSPRKLWRFIQWRLCRQKDSDKRPFTDTYKQELPGGEALILKEEQDPETFWHPPSPPKGVTAKYRRPMSDESVLEVTFTIRRTWIRWNLSIEGDDLTLVFTCSPPNPRRQTPISFLFVEANGHRQTNEHAIIKLKAMFRIIEAQSPNQTIPSHNLDSNELRNRLVNRRHSIKSAGSPVKSTLLSPRAGGGFNGKELARDTAFDVCAAMIESIDKIHQNCSFASTLNVRSITAECSAVADLCHNFIANHCPYEFT